MKKIIVLTIITLLVIVSLSAQKYCGDIHEYLFEQGVELLNEYKYYSEFQAGIGPGNPLYNLMQEGSSAEDEMDWVYGYSEVGGPEIDIWGVDDLTEWFLESYCKTITHFWDADNFDVFETNGHNLVSGFVFGNEFTIHDIPSAVTKAYTTLFGYNHKVHYKYKSYIAPAEMMQFELVNGGNVSLWSLEKDFKVSIESLDDYINNHNVYIVAHYIENGQLSYFDSPYYVHMGDSMWNDFTSQNPYWEYSYAGRIIHLIGDMAVPAHVHNDQHPPMPFWIVFLIELGWDWDYCDDYEGWDYDDGPIGPTGEGGYLRNRVWLVEDWDAESILENYGGLIARPSECNGEDFIFDLFYSINQVTDVIASDDKPGDWDLDPDHPLDDYPFIEDMFNRLQDSSLYPYFSTGTLQLLMDPHEKCSVNYECDKIRDICIPLAIRGTATFLEWWAQWNGFTPTYVSYREIDCQVGVFDFNTGAQLPLPDNIHEATVEFAKQGSNEVYTFHPDSEGYISTVFIGDQVGSNLHDVVYDITTYLDENYWSNPITDVVINGSEDLLEITCTLFENPVNSISGIVTLSGNGGGSVENVVVSAGGITVNPDYTGYYIIDGLLPGTYEVTALLAGYTIETQDAIVIEDEPTIDINFNLMSIVPAGYIFVSHNGNGHFNSIEGALYYLYNNGQLYNTIILDDGYYYEDFLVWPGDYGHLILKSLNGPKNCTLRSSCFTVFRFFNCYGSDPSLNGLEGITLSSFCISNPAIDIFSSSVTIKNCFIIGYDNEGILLSGDGANSTVNIVNNVISNCTSAISIGAGNYPEAPDIRNNIIYNNDYAISGGNPTVEYCNIYGNLDDDIWNGNGVIHKDPFFADPSTGNYSLLWNATNFSPCIDTGDPDEQYNDPDGTPSDMGAIPTISHEYFVNQYDDEVFDRIEWISFPALNRTTNGYMEALNVLERQELIDDDGEFLDDILDHVLFEGEDAVWFNVQWQTNLVDGNFDSRQGYIFVLQEDYDDIPMRGISGTWEDESTPIQLFANKENWVGCFLEESASLADAFESISDEWTEIRSEHWAVEREPSQPTPHIRGTVNPGELYIIRVENDCQLIWNNSGGGVVPHIREKTEYFTYEETVDYMPITVDTVYSDTTVTEIAVYSDDKCIGASKLSDGYPVQILAYTPETLKNGNNGLEFMLLYEGQKKTSSKSIPYITYSKEAQAFIAQPLYYDRKAFATVQLNTYESSYTQQIALMQNYPNPVRTNTTHINFMPAINAQHTELNIYNLKGQLIHTIDCDGIISSGTKNGYYSLTWDCCDRYGKDVKNGIYFYKLTSDEKSTVNKMLIMK